MTKFKCKINRLEENQKKDLEITHAEHKNFSKRLKDKIKQRSKKIKRTIAVLTMLGIQVAYASFNAPNMELLTVTVMDDNQVKQIMVENSVDTIVKIKTEKLQDQILSNVDSLQRLIIQAKRTGNKNKVVKKILDDVFPMGGLPGSTHYCVAGAAKAKLMCNDSTLNSIMPDPTKRPREYGFPSSPNVSCPFMRQYFKDTLGENYAQKGDSNFNEVVNSLEAGDIITVRSIRNTSSGEHCVTVAGPMQENGTIPVMSLNTEDNYNVLPRQIIGAAKIIAQYRQELTNSLTLYYEEQYKKDNSVYRMKTRAVVEQRDCLYMDTAHYFQQLAKNRIL